MFSPSKHFSSPLVFVPRHLIRPGWLAEAEWLVLTLPCLETVARRQRTQCQEMTPKLNYILNLNIQLSF